MPAVTPTRVNDFTIKIGTVNGTGSASANTLLMKSPFRSGILVMGKNYFVEHPGSADSVRDPRYARRAMWPDPGCRHHGGDECRDRRAGREGSHPGGLPRLRLDRPRPALLKREDITVYGVLARLCEQNFNCVRTRILMKNICYAGVLAALLNLDLARIRELLAETYAKKQQLLDANMKAIQLGYDYARANFSCPLPLHVEKMDGTGGHIMIDGNTAAALGCLFAAPGGGVVPDHPFHLAHGRFQDVRRPHGVDATGCKNCFIQADELAAIGMVIGHVERARFYRHSPVRHLAHERVPGAGVLRGNTGGGVRYPASRSVDRHADAHPAV